MNFMLMDTKETAVKYVAYLAIAKRSLHSHYKSIHKDVDRICLDCGQIFSNKIKLTEHMSKIKHGASLICHKCGESFSRNQQYKLHLKRHDTYKCFNCNVFFANSKKLDKHLQQCITLTSVRSKPMNHIKNKINNKVIIYECIVCKETFEKKKHYRRHMKTATHTSDNVETDTFYCAHCPKVFYYKFKLSNHLKQVHFKQYNNYTCNLCGKHFLYRNNYKRHKDSHLEIRNYVCEYCGACFYQKCALIDHQTAIHNEEKNFVCNECGKNFKLRSILTRHMKNHSETKILECHCKKVFKFTSNLRRHQVNVHNQINYNPSKIKRFVQDDSRSSPLMVKQEKKKLANFKHSNYSNFMIGDTDQYSIMEYSDNLDLSNVEIAEKVLQVASSTDYKIECEENSCFPGIHPPIETSLVCSLNDGTDLSPNSSQQYVLSDYVVPHQFPFLNI
ncbi:zinc finger protein 154-like isoform X2 [Daktulosphaira vitifoliae]|uniref:zinc finger protein 154-like isoform X2 n=1 Tax=Daktulosphaira vitifoliae TaxID=58002 RepID=UPI0021A98E8E|nr:zinc finger protein 154-like isoform X2 [Daktulosphaira vitifoliae]